MNTQAFASQSTPTVTGASVRPWRAVLGAVVMGLASGAGPALGEPAARVLGLTGLPARLLPAALVTAIAVPLIMILHRRDRAPNRRLGLTGLRESAVAFALGIFVTSGAAALAFGTATCLGWLRWHDLDPIALATFVATNGIVALLLEALPEELTLRGYAWGTLRERYGPVRTGLLTTALFLVVVPIASLIQLLFAAASSDGAASVRIAPVGEDPVAYVVLLMCFSLMLVTARTATVSTSVWTCVGAHLTLLTVNRVVLFGEQRNAGWSAELLNPNALLLVPGYLLLATLAFAAIGRAARRQPAR